MGKFWGCLVLSLTKMPTAGSGLPSDFLGTMAHETARQRVSLYFASFLRCYLPLSVSLQFLIRGRMARIPQSLVESVATTTPVSRVCRASGGAPDLRYTIKLQIMPQDVDAAWTISSRICSRV